MKTSELEGAALDWAVAKCEKSGVTVVASDGKLRSMPNKPFGDPVIYSPSTHWAQGGPIIEREDISIMKSTEGDWHACNNFSALGHLHGDTPLIAAMRCCVASKLGDEVDIPEELK